MELRREGFAKQLRVHLPLRAVLGDRLPAAGARRLPVDAAVARARRAAVRRRIGPAELLLLRAAQRGLQGRRPLGRIPARARHGPGACRRRRHRAVRRAAKRARARGRGVGGRRDHRHVVGRQGIRWRGGLAVRRLRAGHGRVHRRVLAVGQQGRDDRDAGAVLVRPRHGAAAVPGAARHRDAIGPRRSVGDPPRSAPRDRRDRRAQPGRVHPGARRVHAGARELRGARARDQHPLRRDPRTAPARRVRRAAPPRGRDRDRRRRVRARAGVSGMVAYSGCTRLVVR